MPSSVETWLLKWDCCGLANTERCVRMSPLLTAWHSRLRDCLCLVELQKQFTEVSDCLVELFKKTVLVATCYCGTDFGHVQNVHIECPYLLLHGHLETWGRSTCTCDMSFFVLSLIKFLLTIQTNRKYLAFILNQNFYIFILYAIFYETFLHI